MEVTTSRNSFRKYLQQDETVSLNKVNFPGIYDDFIFNQDRNCAIIKTYLNVDLFVVFLDIPVFNKVDTSYQEFVHLNGP